MLRVNMANNTIRTKFTLQDLRSARLSGRKIPMLTCYDYSMARVMEEAGVPMLLTGDSAANVILGHSSTVPIRLPFLIELTAAVRRGAPLAFVLADMPFGSYQASEAQGIRNVTRMVQLTGCDGVKLEVADSHAGLVRKLADMGVAVMAHLGLRPQSVGVLGGYATQGRTSQEAQVILDQARRFEDAGAAAILLEAVPPETSQQVVEGIGLPVIGCGAGPACHGHVFVTHDALGFTAHKPRFVPDLGDIAGAMRQAFALYVKQVQEGQYPGPQHAYKMAAGKTPQQ